MSDKSGETWLVSGVINMDLEEYHTLHGFLVVMVHGEETCQGEGCVFHRPSWSPLVNFPIYAQIPVLYFWRRCPHGDFHRDPDDARWHNERPGFLTCQFQFTCDGCCARD